MVPRPIESAVPARVTMAEMESRDKQGRTDYDWVNGMRVGILAGGIVGVLIGWLTGVIPLLMALLGAAGGGFLGARLADRW
jgi:uncharacterized protein YcfJ